MNTRFLLLAISAALFTSCSTYRAGQTPDDVYYSPARDINVRHETKVEEKRDKYDDYASTQDDRYLRRKIQDRERWSAIDDYSYWYDSRYNHMDCYSYYRYNPWSQQYRYNNWSYNQWSPNYFGYGGGYSPAYPIVYYKNPKVYTGSTGKSNLTTYSNRVYSNQNASGSSGVSTKGRSNNDNFGSLMKRVFSAPANTSNGSEQTTSYDRPVRTIEPSSTPSSNAGGRSGGYNSSGSSSSSGRPPR